jgi:hypothetical protein
MSKSSSELENALTEVDTAIREGLKHGFFEYRLKCEIRTGRKRELILEAGKSYKFTIPEEEVITR